MTTEERLEKFLSKDPSIHDSAYVADQATLLGDVRIGEQASVWPGCVLRGDINYISIGNRSNVQDGTIVHLADDYPVDVGNDVTIGHAAIIHACKIEDECLIGMGATVMDGAVIGSRSIVGANALVTQGTIVPPGSLVLGSPAKVVKSLSDVQQSKLKDMAAKYVTVSSTHKKKYQSGD
ncbi:gamma carbonic anhydrase family protein [Puniceicoccaceae bacterium K14]|nr:gamma carbonic anhydrase family protein [Puniceicoccaceae bacterium K14]